MIPQLAFLILGIVLIVLSVILTVVALVYFFKQNIRAVMDDLSGKTRNMNVGAPSNAARRASSRKRKSAPVLREEKMPTGAEVRNAPIDTSERNEDELSTVLDTKLRKVPHDVSSINSNIRDVNDDMSTLVTATDRYYQSKIAENEVEVRASRGDENPTMVGDESPTMVGGESGTASGFVVTQTIVSINTSEIITASEE